MDVFLSLVKDDITVINVMVICIVLWIKSDLRRVDETLKNGLVKKVAELTTATLLSSQDFLSFKNEIKEDYKEMKEACAEHRKGIAEQLRK